MRTIRRARATRVALVTAWSLTLALFTLPSAADPPAGQEPLAFDIQTQPLASALNAFALQSHQQILFIPEIARGKTSQGVNGVLTPDAALQRLLANTGLVATRASEGMVLVGPADAREALARSEFQLAPNGVTREPSTPGITAASGRTDGPAPLEEIIVTARKSAESIESVPLAIRSFDPARLARGGQGGLLDISALTPGFVFQTYGSSFDSSPTIRGLTQFDITSPVANVATVVDGVYLPRNYSVDLGIADLSRVEITKGPQSALYGSNAFAGVIGYTLAPPPERPEASASATAGNAGRWDYKLAAGDSFADGLFAARINYASSRYEGSWRNLFPANPYGQVPSLGGHDDSTWGATVRITPVKTVEIDFDWFHLDRHEDLKPDFNVTSYDPDNYYNCNPFICGTLSWNAAVYQSALSKHYPGLEQPFTPGFTAATDFYSARLNWTLTEALQFHYTYGWVNAWATGITQASDDPLHPNTLNYNYYGGCLAGNSTDCGLVSTTGTNWDTSDKEGGANKLGSHELRLEWNHGPLKALIGGYLAHDTDFYQFADGSFAAGTALTGGAPTNPYDFSDFLLPLLGQYRTTATSAEFARVSVDFPGARANLAAEARHQTDELGSVASLTGSLQDAPSMDIVYRRASYSYTTPRITATYKLTPLELLYGSAAQGVKAGGFNPPTDGGPTNPIPPAEQTFAPEKNWTYEIGSKNTFLDGRAIVNADVFYVKWSNLQIEEEPSNAGSNIEANITVNQGGATSRGFESDGRFAATRNLQLQYGFAYIDSTFDAGDISGQVVGICNGIVCPVNGAIGGRMLPRYSKIQATGGATWKQAVTPTVSWNLHGEFTYQSQQQADEENITQIPARTLVNLSGGVGGEHWDLTLWGRNVFNLHYVADAYYIPFATFHAVTYSPSLGELATFGVTLNVHLY